MGRSQNRAALQPFLHQFPTLTNREMFWANKVFSGRNREFRRYSVRRPVLPRLPIIGGHCGPKVATIGSGPIAPHPVTVPFRQRLREVGLIEGRTFGFRAATRTAMSTVVGRVPRGFVALFGRPIFNDATIPAWMRCMLRYPSSSDSERCFGQRRRHFADADVPTSSMSFQEEPSNFAIRSDS